MSTTNPLAHEPKRELIVPSEAHAKLARRIYDAAFDRIGEWFAAKLIAESEARAVQSARRNSLIVEHELAQLRAQVALDEKAKALMLREHFKDMDEIKQLRAEVERLNDELVKLHGFADMEMKARYRAEKAEAALANAQSASAKCPHVVTSREGTAHCSLAERDGRELAKLRDETGKATDEPNANGSVHARLNWWKVASDEVHEELAKEREKIEALLKMLGSNIRFNEERNAYEWVIYGSLGNMSQSVESAIDAAMKEEKP